MNEQSDERATGFNEPTIRRGRVDSLTLYEITENELETLEKGSPTSTYLNFSILFISTGISFLISLLTATLNDRIFIVFVAISGIGLSIGIVLCVIWWRFGGEAASVCERIRERIAE